MKLPHRPYRVKGWWTLPALLLFLGGCATSRPPAPEGPAPSPVDTLHTALITPPDSSLEYFYYPAPFDSVWILPRWVGWTPDSLPQFQVEVLIKGGLPDTCTELHDVDQRRVGHFIEVSLVVRRPRGRICMNVVRPYRFFLRLEGYFTPGAYVLRLNDRPYPFEIHPRIP